MCRTGGLDVASVLYIFLVLHACERLPACQVKSYFAWCLAQVHAVGHLWIGSASQLAIRLDTLFFDATRCDN